MDTLSWLLVVAIASSLVLLGIAFVLWQIVIVLWRISRNLEQGLSAIAVVATATAKLDDAAKEKLLAALSEIETR